MQPTVNISNDSQFMKSYRWWTAIAMLVLMVGWTSAADASYNYRKRITIDHSRVGSDCTHCIGLRCAGDGDHPAAAALRQLHRCGPYAPGSPGETLKMPRH